MRILDLGCGTGKLLFALADQAPADSEFYGCDYSPDQLRYAERVAVRYRQRIHFTHASMDELRFPDSYFDIVMSSMALHAANPGIRKKAISEVSRMLKANGIFLLLESGTPRFGLITLLFSLFGKMHTRNAYDPCLTDEYCRGSCLKVEKESDLNSLVRRQIFRKYT